MNPTLLAIISIFLLLARPNIAPAKVKRVDVATGAELCKTLNQMYTSLKNVDLKRSVRFVVKDGLYVAGSLDLTTKGNGTLSVGGLSLRVFDDHDDGSVYVPPCSELKMVDVNNDGFKDLTFEGGRKATDTNKTESFSFQYLYRSESKAFQKSDDRPTEFFEL